MLEREQFTFYRSFWEAIQVLPKKDRLPILEAIISYGLDGAEPECLSQSQLAFFLLIRPVLDASRKKAESGKQGGSKPKANGKQTASKKEKEGEKEKEIETEGEKDKKQTESAPFDGKAFTTFWEAYPRKIAREEAWEAWKTLKPDGETAQRIMTGLEIWKKSEQWQDDGGRYIPGAAKFLAQRYWDCPPVPGGIPQGASGELGEAELEAIGRVLAEEVPV